MPRLVSITITTLMSDDTPADTLADVIYNVAEVGVDTWADVNEWDVVFLDSEVTLNVEAE